MSDHQSEQGRKVGKVTITNPDAEWLVTFAAGGLFQTVAFDNREDALALLNDPWLNKPNWSRAPRLWTRVTGFDAISGDPVGVVPPDVVVPPGADDE